MPWFKVDDGFTSSRKVISIPRQHRMLAIGAWTMAGNFAAKELTDGHVPQYYLDEIGATDDIVELLINADLWLKHEDGIQFKNWCEYQPSATDYIERLERERARRVANGKAGADKRWNKVTNSGTNGTTNGVTMGQDAPEPEPEPEPFTSNEVNTYDDFTIVWDSAFDEFWAFYPRKIGKGGAKKTWAKITRGVKPEVVIEGARRMASDPNLPETQFIPHPSTWLNEGRWDDEPYAPRGKTNLKELQREQASEKFLASFNQQPELTANPDWA